MKAISLSNFFAVFCFLTVGFQIETAWGQGQTYSQCSANVRAEPSNNINTLKNSPSCASRTDKDACANEIVNRNIEASCSNLAGSNSAAGDCRSLLNTYDTAVQKTVEECSRMNVSSIQDCQSRAAQCSGRTDTFGSDSGITNLMSAVFQMQGGATQSADGCYIADDDRSAREQERLDDRISRLREQIADDREEANKADEDLNKKRREVEEDMAEVEEDFNKKNIERQTKNQESAAALQKQILEAEKRRRNNANQIAEKTVAMANIAFDQQQVTLEFAQSRVTAACDQRIETMKEQKTMTTDASGKKKKKNLTAAQANQIKRLLEAEQESCYREVALGQQRKTKDLMDKKNKLQREIDELNASSADENKAIENQKKSIEDMKAILTQEEAKELEIKMKKLDSLNKSVTDMEQSVQRKKQIIADKIAGRELDIARLLEQKNNVQRRFAQVSSQVSNSGVAARNFVGQCCGSSSRRSTGSATSGYAASTATGFESACARVTTDYNVRPSTAGGSMGGSGTGQ